MSSRSKRTWIYSRFFCLSGMHILKTEFTLNYADSPFFLAFFTSFYNTVISERPGINWQLFRRLDIYISGNFKCSKKPRFIFVSSILFVNRFLIRLIDCKLIPSLSDKDSMLSNIHLPIIADQSSLQLYVILTLHRRW